MDFFFQLFSDPVGFYNSHELLIAQMGVNGLLAASIFVVMYSGQLSLASPGFMAIGAYTSVLLGEYVPAIPYPVAVILSSLLAGLAGVAVGLPVLRLRGVFLAIATIGFIEALRLGVILNLPITGEGLGLKNPNADPLGGLNAILISLVVVIFVLWRLSGTKLGQAWSAIRGDEIAALTQSINVPLYRLAAFALSAVLAGYAGALESHINFFLDPNEYGVPRAVQILTFAVLGGSATVFGPVVGAVFLTALPEIIRGAAAYRDILNGIILIVVIIFRPRGLLSAGRLAIPRPLRWPRRPRAPA